MFDYLPSHRSALVGLDAHCVGLAPVHSSQVRGLSQSSTEARGKKRRHTRRRLPGLRGGRQRCRRSRRTPLPTRSGSCRARSILSAKPANGLLAAPPHASSGRACVKVQGPAVLDCVYLRIQERLAAEGQSERNARRRLVRVGHHQLVVLVRDEDSEQALRCDGRACVVDDTPVSSQETSASQLPLLRRWWRRRDNSRDDASTTAAASAATMRQ